jgi:hypothetical protein
MPQPLAVQYYCRHCLNKPRGNSVLNYVNITFCEEVSVTNVGLTIVSLLESLQRLEDSKDYVLTFKIVLNYPQNITHHRDVSLYNVKNQLHVHFSYIKMFNYNPTCFKPISGSPSGMSQIIITHIIHQYKCNFRIQLFNLLKPGGNFPYYQA